MPFAALETRLNASVFKHMANVRVSLGGVDVDAMFKNNYVAAGGGVGMATTVPALTVPTSRVPDAPVGQTVTVNGTMYEIATHEPDGTGISVLMLEATS